MLRKTFERMYQETLTASNGSGYGEQRHRQPGKRGKEGGIKVLASLGKATSLVNRRAAVLI